MLNEMNRLSEKYIPADVYDRIWGWFVFIRNIAGIYIIWIFTHYIAAHLYVNWCVPATIAGFIVSPFLIPAPHCQALRWAVYNGGNSVMAMWGALGLWLMKKISLTE